MIDIDSIPTIPGTVVIEDWTRSTMTLGEIVVMIRRFEEKNPGYQLVLDRNAISVQVKLYRRHLP